MLHELLPPLTSVGREGLKVLLKQARLAGGWVGTSVKSKWEDLDMRRDGRAGPTCTYLAAQQHLRRWRRSTRGLWFMGESFWEGRRGSRR